MTGAGPVTADLEAMAREVIAAATAAGVTIAVAESLTGGQVSAALVDVPGASVVLKGAVVAYATAVKSSVLGVDPDLLERVGPVDRVVAEQMASGVAALLGADLAVATTGVAGPGAHDGHPAGTVVLGASGPSGTRSVMLHVDGDRQAVRAGATAAAVGLLAELLAVSSTTPGT